MNPTDIKIAQLEQQVSDLMRQMREFTSVAQLDPNIQRTLTTMLTGSSTKTTASATQTVAESGSATYGVMVPPSGFFSIGGKNVPYIN